MADDENQTRMESSSFLSGLSEIEKAVGAGEYGRTVTVQILEATCPTVRVRLGGPGCPWSTIQVPMEGTLTLNRDPTAVRDPLRSTELAFLPATSDSEDAVDHTDGEDTTGRGVVLDILRDTEKVKPTTLSATPITNTHDTDEHTAPFSVTFRWAVGAHLAPVTPPAFFKAAAEAPLPPSPNDGLGSGLEDEELRNLAQAMAPVNKEPTDSDTEATEDTEDGGEVHFHTPPMHSPDKRFVPPAEQASEEDADVGERAVAPLEVEAFGFDPSEKASPASTTATKEVHAVALADTHEAALQPYRFPAPTTAEAEGPLATPPDVPHEPGRSESPRPIHGADESFDTRAASSTHSSRRARPPSGHRRSLHMLVDVVPPESGGRVTDVPLPEHGTNTEDAVREGGDASTAVNGVGYSAGEGNGTTDANAPPSATPYVAVPPQALAPPTPAASTARQLEFAPVAEAARAVSSATPVMVPTAANLFDGAAPDATVAILEVMSLRSEANAAPGRLVQAVFSLKAEDTETATPSTEYVLHRTQLLSRSKAACVPQLSVPVLLPEELAADATLPVQCELFEAYDALPRNEDAAAPMTLLWSSSEEVRVASSTLSPNEAVEVAFAGGSDTVTTRWNYTTVGAYRESVLNMRASVASTTAAASLLESGAGGKDSSQGAAPLAQLQVMVEASGALPSGAEESNISLWLSQPTQGCSLSEAATHLREPNGKTSSGPTHSYGGFQCSPAHVSAAVAPLVYFSVDHPYSLLSLVHVSEDATAAENSVTLIYTIPFRAVDEWCKAEPLGSAANTTTSTPVVHYRFLREGSDADTLPDSATFDAAPCTSKNLCELRLDVHSLTITDADKQSDDAAAMVTYTNTPLRIGSRVASPPRQRPLSYTQHDRCYRLAAYDVRTGAVQGVSRAFTADNCSSGRELDENRVLSLQNFFFAEGQGKHSRVQRQQLHIALFAFPSFAAAAQFNPAEPVTTVASNASSTSARLAANVVVDTAVLLQGKAPSTTGTVTFGDPSVSQQQLAEVGASAPAAAHAKLRLEAVRRDASKGETAVFQVQSVCVHDIPTAAASGLTTGSGSTLPLPGVAAQLWFAPSLFDTSDVEAAFAKAQEAKDGPADPRDWALNHRWAPAHSVSMDCTASPQRHQRKTLFTTSDSLRLCVALVPQPSSAARSASQGAHLSLFEADTATPRDLSLSPTPARGDASALASGAAAPDHGLDLLRSKVRHLRKKAWTATSADSNAGWAAAVLAADDAVAMQVDNYAEVDLSPSVRTGCEADRANRRLFESTVVGQVRMNHRLVLEIRGAWLKVPVQPTSAETQEARSLPVAYQPSCRLWAIRGSFVRRGGVVEAVESTEGAGRGDGILASAAAGAGSVLVQSSMCDVTVSTYPIDYTDPSPELVTDALPGISPDAFLQAYRRRQRQRQQQQAPQRSPQRPVLSAATSPSPRRQLPQHRKALAPVTPASALVEPLTAVPPPQSQQPPASWTSPFEEHITTNDALLNPTEGAAQLHVSVHDAAEAARQTHTDPSFLISLLQGKELDSSSHKSTRVIFLFGDAYTTRTGVTVHLAEYPPPSPGTQQAAVTPLSVMDAIQSNGISVGRGTFLLDDTQFFGISHKKFAPVLEWFHGSLGVPRAVEEGRRAEGALLWRTQLSESDLGALRKPHATLAVTTITQEPPSPALLVAAHTLTHCEGNGFLLFGGRDSTRAVCARAAFYWEAEQVWTPFRIIPARLPDGPLPPARQGHAAVYSPTEQSVYVFGGNRSYSESWDRVALLDDVWSIHLEDGVARRVDVDATAVENHVSLARWHHTAVYHDEYMIVVGGECLALDAEDGQSSGDTSSSSTSPRKHKNKRKKHHHRRHQRQRRLTVAPCDPLLYLDLRTGAWEARSCFARDQAPCPRHRHATAVVADTVMYLYGGRDASGGLLGDLHQLDLLTRMWTDVRPNGAVAPPPLELASMAAADVSGTLCLFLVGGRSAPSATTASMEGPLSVYMFCTPTHFWRHVSLSCGPTMQRFATRAVAVARPTGEAAAAARQYRHRKGLPDTKATVTTQLLLVGGLASGPKESPATLDDEEDDNDDSLGGYGLRHAGRKSTQTVGACTLLLSNASIRRTVAAAPPSTSSRNRSAPRPPGTQPLTAPAPRSRRAPPTSKKPRPPPHAAATARSRPAPRHKAHRPPHRLADVDDAAYVDAAAMRVERRRPMSTSEVARCVQRLSSAPPERAPASQSRGRNSARQRSASASPGRSGQSATEYKSAFSTLTREEVRSQIDRLYYHDLQRRRANLRDLSRQIFRERYGADKTGIPPPQHMATPETVQQEEELHFERSHRQSVELDDTTPTHTRATLSVASASDDDGDRVPYPGRNVSKEGDTTSSTALSESEPHSASREEAGAPSESAISSSRSSSSPSRASAASSADAHPPPQPSLSQRTTPKNSASSSLSRTSAGVAPRRDQEGENAASASAHEDHQATVPAQDPPTPQRSRSPSSSSASFSAASSASSSSSRSAPSQHSDQPLAEVSASAASSKAESALPTNAADDADPYGDGDFESDASEDEPPSETKSEAEKMSATEASEEEQAPAPEAAEKLRDSSTEPRAPPEADTASHASSPSHPASTESSHAGETPREAQQLPSDAEQNNHAPLWRDIGEDDDKGEPDGASKGSSSFSSSPPSSPPSPRRPASEEPAAAIEEIREEGREEREEDGKETEEAKPAAFHLPTPAELVQSDSDDAARTAASTSSPRPSSRESESSSVPVDVGESEDRAQPAARALPTSPSSSSSQALEAAEAPEAASENGSDSNATVSASASALEGANTPPEQESHPRMTDSEASSPAEEPLSSPLHENIEEQMPRAVLDAEKAASRDSNDMPHQPPTPEREGDASETKEMLGEPNGSRELEHFSSREGAPVLPAPVEEMQSESDEAPNAHGEASAEEPLGASSSSDSSDGDKKSNTDPDRAEMENVEEYQPETLAAEVAQAADDEPPSATEDAESQHAEMDETPDKDADPEPHQAKADAESWPSASVRTAEHQSAAPVVFAKPQDTLEPKEADADSVGEALPFEFSGPAPPSSSSSSAASAVEHQAPEEERKAEPEDSLASSSSSRENPLPIDPASEDDKSADAEPIAKSPSMASEASKEKTPTASDTEEEAHTEPEEHEGGDDDKKEIDDAPEKEVEPEDADPEPHQAKADAESWPSASVRTAEHQSAAPVVFAKSQDTAEPKDADPDAPDEALPSNSSGSAPSSSPSSSNSSPASAAALPPASAVEEEAAPVTEADESEHTASVSDHPSTKPETSVLPELEQSHSHPESLVSSASPSSGLSIALEDSHKESQAASDMEEDAQSAHETGDDDDKKMELAASEDEAEPEDADPEVADPEPHQAKADAESWPSASVRTAEHQSAAPVVFAKQQDTLEPKEADADSVGEALPFDFSGPAPPSSSSSSAASAMEHQAPEEERKAEPEDSLASSSSSRENPLPVDPASEDDKSVDAGPIAKSPSMASEASKEKTPTASDTEEEAHTEPEEHEGGDDDKKEIDDAPEKEVEPEDADPEPHRAKADAESWPSASVRTAEHQSAAPVVFAKQQDTLEPKEADADSVGEALPFDFSGPAPPSSSSSSAASAVEHQAPEEERKSEPEDSLASSSSSRENPLPIDPASEDDKSADAGPTAKSPSMASEAIKEKTPTASDTEEEAHTEPEEHKDGDGETKEEDARPMADEPEEEMSSPSVHHHAVEMAREDASWREIGEDNSTSTTSEVNQASEAATPTARVDSTANADASSSRRASPSIRQWREIGDDEEDSSNDAPSPSSSRPRLSNADKAMGSDTSSSDHSELEQANSHQIPEETDVVDAHPVKPLSAGEEDEEEEDKVSVPVPVQHNSANSSSGAADPWRELDDPAETPPAKMRSPSGDPLQGSERKDEPLSASSSSGLGKQVLPAPHSVDGSSPAHSVSPSRSADTSRKSSLNPTVASGGDAAAGAPLAAGASALGGAQSPLAAGETSVESIPMVDTPNRTSSSSNGGNMSTSSSDAYKDGDGSSSNNSDKDEEAAADEGGEIPAEVSQVPADTLHAPNMMAFDSEEESGEEEEQSWRELGDEASDRRGSDAREVAGDAAPAEVGPDADGESASRPAHEDGEADSWRELGEAGTSGANDPVGSPSSSLTQAARRLEGAMWVGDSEASLSSDEEMEVVEEAKKTAPPASLLASAPETPLAAAAVREEMVQPSPTKSEPEADAPVPDPWAELGDSTGNEKDEGSDTESRRADAAAAARDLLDRKQGVEEAIDEDDFDF